MSKARKRQPGWWQLTIPTMSRSLRREIVTSPPVALFFFAIWLLMTLAVYPAGKPFAGKSLLTLMVIVSLAMVPAMLFASRRVRRAKTAYMLQFIGLVPGIVASLIAALSLYQALVGMESAVRLVGWMGGGVLVVPLLGAWNSRRMREAIKADRKRLRLVFEHGLWDASKDAERVEQFNRKPPLWARLLLMIGPALGLNLRRLVGEDNAILVIVVGGLFLPYIGLIWGTVLNIARLKFFTELEREIGRPILLAEEA
jgi:hypothetical protein